MKEGKILDSAISIILFILIFLFFSIKKQYVEIIVILIIELIIDFVTVQALSSAPVLGMIAISVGKPLIQILIYAIVKMSVMGVFYLLLQKSNVTAIVGYLLINLLFNIFHITLLTISGSIFIDLILNSIIAGIILVTYNKLSFLDEVKWFSISAMIIDFVLASLTRSVFFV